MTVLAERSRDPVGAGFCSEFGTLVWPLPLEDSGSEGHVTSLGLWDSELAKLVLGFGVLRWAGFVLSSEILVWTW